MRAAFIYGGADFYQGSDGIIYSGGTVTTAVWERYLTHFESLVAVGRSMGVAPRDKKLTNVSMENVKITLIPSMSGIQNILLNSSNVRKVCRKVLQDTDYAIIRLPSITGLIACQEANKLDKPYMVEVVGCINDTLWHHGSLRGKIAAKPLSLLNRSAIKKAPFAIYVSEHFLQKKYPCNGETCGCSDVSINSFDESILKTRKERIKKMSSDKPIKFGLVGSLNVDYKGHQIAMRAFSLIKDKVNFELHFLGGGNKQRWEQLANDLGIGNKVTFHGVLPSGQPVLNWMDELDLYLIPSLTEGLPRALVEAMSRGLPAIGANTGGIPELLDREKLHEPNNYRELANKMIEFATDKQKLLDSAERNFNYSKQYSSEILNSRRNEFFNKFKTSKLK